MRARQPSSPHLPHPGPDIPILETEGLTKRYGTVVALDNLTVQFDTGITGLVGANGAGKSTLVKLLLGLIDATEGSARVMGNDIDAELSARYEVTRADQLGAMTGVTMTLIVEVDGDPAPIAGELISAGYIVSRDRANVLLQMPDGSDDASMRITCDAIRDAAVKLDVGLLRIERRRGHLEDLFRTRA